LAEELFEHLEQSSLNETGETSFENVGSELGQLSVPESSDIAEHSDQTVHYPVLPVSDDSCTRDCNSADLKEDPDFEANAPPMFDEEACEAATAPPLMFYEATAPAFEGQLAAEAAATAAEPLQEEAYAIIQPFTESQVWILISRKP